MALDAKQEQLVKIARLYFLEEMNQRDIARKMNMSLAGVSRSITRAKETGIVTVSVNSPDDEAAELEILLEKRFGLRECLLVDSSPTAEIMYADMAAKLSYYLDKILEKGSRIGVSWGLTLKIIGDNLPAQSTTCKAVVPIVGAIGRIETGIFPNSIARSFAEKLGGDCYIVNTPGLVDSEDIRQSLLSDSSFAEIAELWDHLDVALFSVSEMGDGSSVRDLNVLPQKDLGDAKDRGAAMLANFLFFDNDGNPVSTDLAKRIINIEYKALMAIPYRIIVAAGERKIQPLRSALRGELPHVLVTDKDTSRMLLED
ncbi:MAG: sugar-binding domain-containing protein [Spirochaetaceae bacterium]|nr:sugar-binding domain-containing protein [Spirochaetaceae bacterium]